MVNRKFLNCHAKFISYFDVYGFKFQWRVRQFQSRVVKICLDERKSVEAIPNSVKWRKMGATNVANLSCLYWDCHLCRTLFSSFDETSLFDFLSSRKIYFSMMTLDEIGELPHWINWNFLQKKTFNINFRYNFIALFCIHGYLKNGFSLAIWKSPAPTTCLSL